MTPLPPADSIDPKDTIVRACMTWRHEPDARCAFCDGPALVGRLDDRPRLMACHRCQGSARAIASDSSARAS